MTSGVIRLVNVRRDKKEDEYIYIHIYIYILTHTYIYIYALKTARNFPKETDEVLVCFKAFVPPSLFSLSFPYFVSDPQLDLEYRSVSLEGS